MLKIDLNAYARQSRGVTAEDPPPAPGLKIEAAAPPEPDQVPILKIEKMTKCLHGQGCRHLKSEPPASPICTKADGPVWDLKECPLMRWAKKQSKLRKE